MYDKPTNDGDAALPKPRAIRTTRSTIDRDPSRQLWLDAWADPVAEVRAFSSCIHTCNLFGDGDWRLVVADADKKLKVSAVVAIHPYEMQIGKFHGLATAQHT